MAWCWRCADLRRVIKERFDVDLDEVSIGRVLKELGFAHVSPRPQHPKQDPQVLEAFKKTFQRAWQRRLPARTQHRGCRLRSGPKTKCEWARRTVWSTNGQRRGRVRASLRISVTPTPTCSARFVRRVTLAPRSCFLAPMPPPCSFTLRRSVGALPSALTPC